jgi:hypothetical protein
LKYALSSLGRQKPDIPLAKRVGNSIMHNLARSLNANQNARLCFRPNGEWLLPENPPQQKGMTIEEPLALNRCRSLYEGRYQTTIARPELDAGKSLISLQRPRLVGHRVDMAPIVKPKSRIAILLNLENHDIVAQGVNCSPRDEYRITRLGGYADEVIRNGPVIKRLPQNARSCA